MTVAIRAPRINENNRMVLNPLFGNAPRENPSQAWDIACQLLNQGRPIQVSRLHVRHYTVTLESQRLQDEFVQWYHDVFWELFHPHVLAALMGPDTVVDTELRLAFRSVKQVLQVRGRIVLLEPRAFFLAAETKLNAIPVGPNNAYNFDPLQEMYQNLHPSIQRGLMANNLVPPDMPPNETAAATKSRMRAYANIVQTYYTNVTTTTDIGGQASTSTIQANMGFPTCLVSVARVLDGPQADLGRANCATFETLFPDVDPNEGLGPDPLPPPAFVATVGAANPPSWALSAAPLSSTVGAASALANPTLLAQVFTGSPFPMFMLI